MLQIIFYNLIIEKRNIQYSQIHNNNMFSIDRQLVAIILPIFA